MFFRRHCHAIVVGHDPILVAHAAAGAALDDLVRTSTYVTGIDEYFGRALPTSTPVDVRRRSNPDFMVEAEAFAALPPG